MSPAGAGGGGARGGWRRSSRSSRSAGSSTSSASGSAAQYDMAHTPNHSDNCRQRTTFITTTEVCTDSVGYYSLLTSQHIATKNKITEYNHFAIFEF